jgi:hypothetical protein
MVSRFFKKKDKEEKKEEIEQIEEENEEMEERFPRPEEFLKPAQDIWNALPKMRQPIHVRFVILAMAMMLVRPFNQTFDEYTLKQLKVLSNMYKTELESINEAIMRKIPEE